MEKELHEREAKGGSTAEKADTIIIEYLLSDQMSVLYMPKICLKNVK